jgi:pre-mRNA-splicing factor ISY1
MARNREKAQSMLYRFREIQLKEAGLPTISSRPKEAATVMNVRACEKHRANVLKELNSKISRIQDCNSI